MNTSETIAPSSLETLRAMVAGDVSGRRWL